MITIYDLETKEKHTGRLVLPSYIGNLRNEVEWLVEHISRCETVNAREDLEEIIKAIPEILDELKERLDEMIGDENE